MITYKIDEKRKLVIEKSVQNKLLKYCQLEGMNESGGILLGKIKKDYSEYTIIDVTVPAEGDISGRYHFIRNKKNAQKYIDEAWQVSDGEINYLGEWHTHPEFNPSPSFVDRRLIDSCLKTIINVPDTIFLIIIGEEGSFYVGCKSINSKLKQLVQIESKEE